MVSSEQLEIQAKIFGVLLRDARESRGMSMKQCGEALGVSSRVYKNYEEGKKTISLPELEVLAYFLDVPMAHFWQDEVRSDAPEEKMELNLEALMGLRHKMIGLRLQQARLGANMSNADLAEAAGITTRRLNQYESGDQPIPVTELEFMAEALGMKIRDFFETEGPIGAWDRARRAKAAVEQMPDEMQEFIANASNAPYLDLAQRLAAMDVERLRTVAESLLDITY